jgi:hypothetical protein
MNQDKAGAHMEKPAFEPSLLVEYGDAEDITQASPTPNAGSDGSNYTS